MNYRVYGARIPRAGLASVYQLHYLFTVHATYIMVEDIIKSLPMQLFHY